MELTQKKEYREVKDWTQAVMELKGVNSIPIMTIHKSKGLEYDTVIFVGLEDGAFWSFRQQQQEDMCAFFVALSRAKRRAIFTFSNLRTDKFNRTRTQSREQIMTFYELLRESQVVDEVVFTEI
ncbi:3'-5' exonuclease [Fervidicella metallireducens]|nr:3'-5' exonuclease [Fervidicella metallireducens]